MGGMRGDAHDGNRPILCLGIESSCDETSAAIVDSDRNILSHIIYSQIPYGTHTHVQTADETILENGTGYITDIGMTGPKRSVIGMDVEVSFKRFETSLPERYKLSPDPKGKFNSCMFEIDDKTNKVIKIERIR